MALKNITLSAEERLIRKARAKAERECTSLNSEFRAWLERYVRSDVCNLDALMASLEYARPGRTFTRDELNER